MKDLTSKQLAEVNARAALIRRDYPHLGLPTCIQIAKKELGFEKKK